jgi:hypothetical protein
LSFIEGISALELAIKEFIDLKTSKNNVVSQSMKKLSGISMETRVVSVTTAMGSIPLGDIENTIRAIDIRNKIVHEGLYSLGTDSKRILMSLFKTISSLILGPEFKFPDSINLS